MNLVSLLNCIIYRQLPTLICVYIRLFVIHVLCSNYCLLGAKKEITDPSIKHRQEEKEVIKNLH